MITDLITKIFGSKHERDTKKLWPIVEEINLFTEQLQNLSDEELKGKTQEFRQKIKERTSQPDERLKELKEEFTGIETHGLSEEERIEVRAQKESLLQQTKEIREEMAKNVATKPSRLRIGNAWT